MKKKKFFALVFAVTLILTLSYVLSACNSKSGDSSETNTQVDGVDESDIVKIIGNRIYKAQSDGVTVSEANDGIVTLMQSHAIPGFKPKELFAYGKYLVVIGEGTATLVNFNTSYIDYYFTQIYIYDTEAAEGTENILRSTAFGGEYLTSRITGDALYITSRRVQTGYYGYDYDYEYGAHNYYKSIGDYYDSISGGAYAEGQLTLQSAGSSAFLVAKLDLKKIDKSSWLVKIFSANLTDIYCSQYNIFVICGAYYYRSGYGCGGGRSASGMFARLNLLTLEVEASAPIFGNTPTRFGLHDNGQYLFYVNRQSAGTKLTVYNYDLIEINSVNEIAPGESLYAVHYEGNYCYIVTFRQVDPLFKFDISDPYNIKFEGLLKIDGYSTYLQDFGNDRLIGVGYAGNGTASGVKVTLFNTETGAPEEINSIQLGAGSSAEAASEIRAILREPDNNIFAFSATTVLNNNKKTQGAHIYGIGEDGKLTERAFLTNFENGYNQQSGYIQSELSSAEQRLMIKRTIRIGEYLYTIADGCIGAYNLSDFSYIGTTDTRIDKNEVTVTFNTGLEVEGEPYIFTLTVQKGGIVKTPDVYYDFPQEAVSGKWFMGWYKDPELKSPYNFNTSVTEDITVYGWWDSY